MENLKIGSFNTAYDTICRWNAQKIALKITHKSPLLILDRLILPPDELKRTEPVKHTMILGQIDQWRDLEIKTPIKGTIRTYKLV